MSRPLALMVHAVSTAAAPINNTGTVILNLDATVYNAFIWLSVGLAVFTAFLQGLVSTLAFITEDSQYWTFRFRLAKKEHIWWTFISFLLVLSLAFIVITFLSGNTGDSVGILVLASATILAVVQYMVPAWRSRHFIATRWLAWTGNTRTSINASNALVCGDPDRWAGLLEGLEVTSIVETPSDWYGWYLYRASGISQDATDIIRCAESKERKTITQDFVRPIKKNIYVYDDGIEDTDGMPKRVSLLWGRPQNFLPRVSRAISSVPRCLLAPRPLSPDGYICEGVCLALGVLGRTKGLNASTLVFVKKAGVIAFLEDTSTWAPRPAKVLRGAYGKLMDTQFHSLGVDYVNAAVELSLVLMDCPAAAITGWLNNGFEHQDIGLNWQLRNRRTIKMYELNAHYRSSYTSMIISLNYMKWPPLPRDRVRRPDLICTGLLLRAERKPKPLWWSEQEMKDRRNLEMESLTNMGLEAAARLLGLEGFPKNFEDNWDM